jgi:hypothetical protein
MQRTTEMKADHKLSPYLDDEEKEIIESYEAAIDAGLVVPKTEAELAPIRERWKQIVRNTEERRAITLRLQERDIERLKVIALRKGLPYQTLVASVLHQFANGDLVER